MAEVKSLGSWKINGNFEKGCQNKKKALGGNKWVGTAGTSPFGAYG